MDWKILRSAVFDSFWNWLLGGVFTIFSAVTFFVPNLQPVINFPALSQVLSPFGLLIIGLVVWFLGFVWNVRKRLQNKIKGNEKYLAKNSNRVDSTDQRGGITGNINANNVYEGGIHFHGVQPDSKRSEKSPLNDLDSLHSDELNIPNSEKSYQIKPSDKSLRNIARKEYGSTKYAKHLEDVNGKSIPPIGSFITLPPAIILTPASREDGQYASIRVQSKQTEKSVFCTPILSKLLWWNEEKDQWIDKTEKIGDDEGFLSWHHGSDEPEKEIKPDIGGVINIAKFTGMMNFTMYHPKEPLWAGSYKVWIIVKWRKNITDLNYNTERIIICIDTIQSNRKTQYPYELSVKECKNQGW